MVSANIRGVYIYSVYSAGSCKPGTILSTAKTTVCTELNIWETEQKITNHIQGLKKDFLQVTSGQSLNNFTRQSNKHV